MMKVSCNYQISEGHRLICKVNDCVQDLKLTRYQFDGNMSFKYIANLLTALYEMILTVAILFIKGTIGTPVNM